ncbi:MAG: hypothetical protein ABI297_02090 [Ginsengibacter sp.]
MPIFFYRSCFKLPSDRGAGFTASFNAPKTGKALMMIRNSNGQTVYTETIVIIKGINSPIINTLQLNPGMYYISIANEEVNYNGKMQKM